MAENGGGGTDPQPDSITLEELAHQAAAEIAATEAGLNTVSEAPGAVTASDAARAASESAPAVPAPVSVPGSLSGSGNLDLDSIFQNEDPDFSASMAGISADAEFKHEAEIIAPDPAIDAAAIDLGIAIGEGVAQKRSFRERALAPFSFTRQLAAWALVEVRDGAVWLVQVGLKRAATKMLESAKHGLAWAVAAVGKGLALPTRAKVGIVILLALSGLASLIGVAYLKGRRLPTYRFPVFSSFADVADERFEIAPDDRLEEFDSPTRASEHLVLLEKTVANLRRGADSGPTPMGFFEFYLEASSQDAAIEISDRKAEMRDAVHRAVESMTAEELATESGKSKLKLVLRRDANAVLTKGRVRRVFFKTIILKP